MLAARPRGPGRPRLRGAPALPAAGGGRGRRPAVGALNPSQDSWDQAPAAPRSRTTCSARSPSSSGFAPAAAAGVVTTGGTESNLMGLLLARQEAGRRLRADVAGAGVHGLAGARPGCASSAPRSRTSRCSGRRRCWGSASVASSRCRSTADLRMRPAALAGRCSSAADAGRLRWPSSPPPAPPTPAASTRCWSARRCPRRGRGAGSTWTPRTGAARCSPTVWRRLLDGIELADSVSLDLHKLGWQPAAAGMLLTARPRPPGAARAGSPTSTPPTTRRPATRPARPVAADHPPRRRVQDRGDAADARSPRPRRSGRPLPLPRARTRRTASRTTPAWSSPPDPRSRQSSSATDRPPESVGRPGERRAPATAVDRRRGGGRPG